MDFLNPPLTLINKCRAYFAGNDLLRQTSKQCYLLFIAFIAIWMLVPLLSWNGIPLLLNANKRLSLIIILFLAWLLKILAIDMNIPSPLEYKDPAIQKGLLELQQRLAGFVKFLIDTSIIKDKKDFYLSQLPWQIIIGPPHAGKTSLLGHSGIHYILRKQSKTSPAKTQQTQVEWWVTNNSCFIDVPGSYLFSSPHHSRKKWKISDNGTYWRFFLHLIRYWRGKDGINGIIIALPLSDLIKNNSHEVENLLNQLSIRIYELQRFFPHHIPCQLVITKCDLLPGFLEFFAEASDEELAHTWGLSFPTLKPNETRVGQFHRRFDAMIKRLNEQLLWRLHHEHDPLAKPAIKAFPLSLEKLRDVLTRFIKKFDSHASSIKLNNIFLTSALQPAHKNSAAQGDPDAYEIINTAERAIEVINESKTPSQPYFTKQLIQQTLANTAAGIQQPASRKQKYRLAAASIIIGIFCVIAVFVSRDFSQSSEFLYALKYDIYQRESAIQNTANAPDRLNQTLALIEKLRLSSEKNGRYSLTTTYRRDVSEKTAGLYRQALAALFFPELGYYLANYLTIPVNQNLDNIYAALKSYLMLVDPDRMEINYLTNTMQNIMPASFTAEQRQQLINNIQLAVKLHPHPAYSYPAIVNATRQYLNNMPQDKLAYTILKNFANNNKSDNVNPGSLITPPVFTNPQPAVLVPFMFTANGFYRVYPAEIQMAANEAAHGNWILGNLTNPANQTDMDMLVEQLTENYVNEYIHFWEALLNSAEVIKPNDLDQMNTLLSQLISNQSPLLGILQTVHANTFFDPIASNSMALYKLGFLLDKQKGNERQLYQIFTALTNLSRYIENIDHAQDINKAAFDFLAYRMKDPNGNNPITQLKLVARNQPEPLKTWLQSIADNTLRQLMHHAGKYMDLSWQQQVHANYLAFIANRFPFSNNYNAEVDPVNFIKFFGNPGIVINFYRQYLTPFIDTTKPAWQWKRLDGESLPFSRESLSELQQAMHIHRAFFPNDDNKLFVEFTIQPYQIADVFQQIRLSVNNQVFTDTPDTANKSHTFNWPGAQMNGQTMIQLQLPDNQIVRQSYPGVWGWFKFLNQSYDSVVNKKELIVNLSKNQDDAKYLIYTNGQLNPLLTQKLSYFHLPDHLS